MTVLGHDSAALPVPPLRLKRLRLQGVGPSGARFDPLDLDFTTRGAAASRVLLSLTNTGGKSTLITLVSSVIVPGARDQVGGKNLGDYVLTGDTSHVVCEWEDASTGALTVTGVVMEWKDGKRQPTEAQRSLSGMHRTWYLFQTGPGRPGIDDLPFVEDRVRISRDRFVGVLEDMFARHPDMRGLTERTQSRWSTVLDANSSIDPVLFSYQMRMNDSESGAEALLQSFDTAENVVRFFVAALNDEQATSDFTTNLTEYAKVSASRPQLEGLFDFCSAAGPGVGTVARRGLADEQARAALARVEAEGAELSAAIAARIAIDASQLDQLEEEAAVAAARAAGLRRQQNAIPDIRAQLRLEQARARHSERETEAARAAKAASAALAEADAWAAVDDVDDVQDARAARDAAAEALARADEDLAPLRSAVEEKGAALGARIDALIAESKAAEEQAAADKKAASADLDQAQRELSAAGRRLDQAARDRTEADRMIAAADCKSADTTDKRLLRPGESPGAALARWTAERDTAHEEATTARAEAAAAERAYDDNETPFSAAAAEAGDAERAHGAALDRQGSFESDLASLAEDHAITMVLDGPPADADDVARARGLCDTAAADADRRANGHEQRAEAADAQLQHLIVNGTAPPSDDVLAVQRALHDAGLGAATGLEWTDRNISDAADRQEFIRTDPSTAGGVVVTDPARFDEAVTVLSRADLDLRGPVAATIAPDLAELTGTLGARRHVVLPHRATWDRAWAQERQAHLEATATGEAEAGRSARDSAKLHRAGAAEADGFARRWGAMTREQLAAVAEELGDRLSEAVRARDEIAAQRAVNRAAARRHRDAAEEAAARERVAERALKPIEELVELTGRATDAREWLPRIELDRTDALAAQRDAEAARDRALSERDQAGERVVEQRGLRRQFTDQRADVPHASAATDPGGSLSTAAVAYDRARQALANATAGMVEADQLAKAETRLTAAENRLARHRPEALERAAVLLGTVDAADHHQRAQSADVARRHASTAELERLRAHSELERAAERLHESEPTDPGRANHADLATTPDWKPESPEDIDEILVRLEQHNLAVRARVAAAETEEADAKELHRAVLGDIAAMRDTVTMWTAPGPAVSSMAPFTGPKDLARTSMVALIREQREASTTASEARAALAAAISTVRQIAADPKWSHVEGALPIQLRTRPDDALVRDAAALDHQIAALAASARGDLDNMDTHRTILRDSLIQLCKEQRRLLREVTSSSRLPAGLGGLSGATAIKIDFKTAADDEAASRLAERIDGWAQDIAENRRRAPSSDARVRWLADAVGATVVDRPQAGRFTIRVLKPSLDGRPQYCAPDRIPHEFSGGQVLTLAVLVYCALSKVRSSRRASGPRPAGTLLLDNPFGTASAEALIAMQHRLAAHNGVQLVCATGIHDPGVDAAFSGPGSVIAKLRNDGDVRRNLSFLRLRSSIVEGVEIPSALTGTRPATDTRSHVHATTYEIGP